MQMGGLPFEPFAGWGRGGAVIGPHEDLGLCCRQMLNILMDSQGGKIPLPGK